MVAMFVGGVFCKVSVVSSRFSESIVVNPHGYAALLILFDDWIVADQCEI